MDIQQLQAAIDTVDVQQWDDPLVIAVPAGIRTRALKESGAELLAEDTVDHDYYLVESGPLPIHVDYAVPLSSMRH